MFSVCPSFGNPFETSHKVGFSCTVKIQKKEFFKFFFIIFCVWVTAVDFVKLWLNHMVECFDGLRCPTKRTSNGHR